MRWLKSLAVYAGVAAILTQAAVPEALSEAFVSGMTLSVKFGDTGIQDDSVASAGCEYLDFEIRVYASYIY